MAEQSRDERQTGIERITVAERTFTPEQVALIKNTVCRDATDDELRMFIAVAGRTGLDPFTKQIHYVKRWDSTLKAMVGAIQVGIDGYRLIAARTGKYGGQDAPEWCGEDGHWRDVWLEDSPPAAARVRVYHLDFPDRPVVGIARWKAFVQTRKNGEERVPNAIWTQYDAEQLAKCAEAMALRKAFPNELDATQTEEELPAALLERDGRRNGLRGVTAAAERSVAEVVNGREHDEAEEPDSIASELAPAGPTIEVFMTACNAIKKALGRTVLKKVNVDPQTGKEHQLWFIDMDMIGASGLPLNSVQVTDADKYVLNPETGRILLDEMQRRLEGARVKAGA